jgi:ABC-type branched-subunit amino acid transport system ATPase component
MHLRRIQIKNFRAISDLRLNFEDSMGRIRPVSVIAGPNGSGKTSVLFAIVQALRGALGARILDVPMPSEADLHRGDPTGRRPVTATVDLDLVYSQPEMNAIVDVFNKTDSLRKSAGLGELHPPALTAGKLHLKWQYPPRLLRDGSLARTDDLQSDPDYGFLWLKGPGAAWRGWKNRLLASVADLYPIGMLNMFPQNRDRRWEEADWNGDEGEDGGIDTPLGAAGPRNGYADEPTVSDSLRRLGEWAHGQGLDANDDRRTWESQLQDRFNQICSPKKYKGYWLDHPRYGESPLLEDAGREYPFRTAANGELVILHYLTKLTFPRPVHNSLILIDEPELHLHPKWIRQLYRALPSMGDNNQFILVTHSAELKQLAAEANTLIPFGDLGAQSGSGVNA